MTWDIVDEPQSRMLNTQKKSDKPVGVPMHLRLIDHNHHLSATAHFALPYSARPLAVSMA